MLNSIKYHLVMFIKRRMIFLFHKFTSVLFKNRFKIKISKKPVYKRIFISSHI